MKTSYTIRKRKDSGKWQAIIKQKQNNRWKQVESKTFEKKIDATQWANLNSAEWQKKIENDYDKMTIAELKELYLDYKKHTVKETTFITEKSAIKNADWFDDRRVSEIKSHEYQEINNTKPATHIAYMKTFYNYLINNLDMDIKNKFNTKPKEKKSKTFVINEQDLYNILNLVDKNHYKIAIKILFFTGIRVSELAGLTIDSIKDNHIIIDKQWSMKLHRFISLKSTNSYREIPINLKLKKELKNFIKDQKVLNIDNRLFPYQCYMNMLGRELKIKFKDTEYEGLTCHDFRHSFISNLIEKRVDPITVAYLAGDNVETILKFYTHITKQTKDNATKAIQSL